MANRRRFWMSLFSFLLVATTLALPTAAPAAAQDVAPIKLDLKNVDDLLWVEATERLFVSGGTTATSHNRLIVLDDTGKVIKTHTNVTGVRDLTYDDKNGRVWMAHQGPGNKKVTAYDATTGNAVDTVTLNGGADMCPATVTVTFEKLVVGSSCGTRIAVINLDTAGGPIDVLDYHTGVDAGIRLSAPEPRPGLKRVAALSPTALTLISDINKPDPLAEGNIVTKAVTTGDFDLAVDDDAIRFAVAGANIALYSGNDLDGPVTKMTAGTVYAVDFNLDGTVVALQDKAPHLVAFKPQAQFTAPFWTHNLGPDVVPIENALEVAHDGRVFVLLEIDGGVGVVVPPPPPPGGGGGGGGGGGPIVGNPGSISGSISLVGAPVGPGPTTLQAQLFDPFGTLVATETVGANGGAYTFTSVSSGTHHVGFRALRNGVPAGYFSELYQDVGFLQHDIAAAVVVTAGNETSNINGTLVPFFTDILTSVFLQDIVWMADTAITRGCNPPANTRYCPEDTVTRGQMAAFLVRAFGYTAIAPAFGDTAGSVFETDIRRLAAAGVTKGCNPPANDRYCPDELVTRGQMAAFLNRAFGLAG